MTQEKSNNLESVIAIHNIIESRFRMQHELVEQLDAKLALAITFSGIIIAIISQVESSNKGLFFFLAVSSLIVSIVLSFVAYKTEKYRRDPDPKMLAKKYINKSNQQILKKVIANLITAYYENRGKLRRKAKLFSVSLLFLAFGLACLLLRLIF